MARIFLFVIVFGIIGCSKPADLKPLNEYVKAAEIAIRENAANAYAFSENIGNHEKVEEIMAEADPIVSASKIKLNELYSKAKRSMPADFKPRFEELHLSVLDLVESWTGQYHTEITMPLLQKLRDFQTRVQVSQL